MLLFTMSTVMMIYIYINGCLSLPGPRPDVAAKEQLQSKHDLGHRLCYGEGEGRRERGGGGGGGGGERAASWKTAQGEVSYV